MNGNLILYGMAAISGLITFLFLVANQRRHFWYALITSIILFIIMTIILDRAVWSLYFKVNPEYEEIGLGEGFAVAVIFSLSLIGNTLGAISAFVVTYIKAKKDKKSQLMESVQD